MSYILASWAFASLLAVIFFRRQLVWWRRREIVRRHDCRPIVQYPSVERFGRDYDRLVKESFQSGRMNKTAMEQFEMCGSNTYEVRSVNDRVILTMDPANLQAIHVRMDEWVRDVRPAGFPFSGGNNILNQNGAEWKHSRELVTPLFKRAELRDIEQFEKFTTRFIDQIPRDGRTVDLQPLLRKLFIDSSSEFTFGKSLDILRSASGESDSFISAFKRAHAGAGKRIRPTGLKLWWNNLGTWDQKWLADCKVVHDFIDERIVEYRSREKDLPKQSKRYVLIEGMSEAFPDPITLRFQLLGIFASAIQNGAMLFANCMFMLARNPHVWSELRKQAMTVGPNEAISFDQLHSLKIFRYTIMETLRLHSPVPRTRRVAAKDTVLPRGGGPDGSSPAFVAKGTAIWGDRYPKSYDPSIWGEDVEAFRPLRFEGKKIGWEFQPFGGGPRICPASQQVISQCMYLLFRMVCEFESIENGDSCLEFVEAIQMCLESKNGCKVVLHPSQG